jgi:hypothetical protein
MSQTGLSTLSEGTALPHDAASPPVATQPVLATASVVRPLADGDLHDVAALFLRVFRRGARPEHAALVERCLRDALYRPDRLSKQAAGQVYVGRGGCVEGFVGCVAQPMRLDGRPISGLAGSILMLDPAQRGDATALIRLLRAFFDVPHDLCFADTANPVARAVLERMGATYLPLQSIDWLVIRSRAGLAARAALDRVRLKALDGALGFGMRAWTGWSKPQGAGSRRKPKTRMTVPADTDALADAIVALSAGYALHPDWAANRATLLFRLGEAAKLRRNGALRARILVEAGGAPVGCWLAHLKPGGVARVLQMLGGPDHMDALLADLAEEAGRVGCVAVRGRLQPDLLPALTRRRMIFMPRLATLVRSNDPAVVARCAEAPALLTGLSGETWSRLFDDDFG